MHYNPWLVSSKCCAFYKFNPILNFAPYFIPFREGLPKYDYNFVMSFFFTIILKFLLGLFNDNNIWNKHQINISLKMKMSLGHLSV